jgi:hypothetical protein
MDISRRANREDDEITLQYQSPQETLLVEQLNEEKVTQLLESINGLEQTPAGAVKLRRRIKLFGECKQTEDETAGEFYARLRDWLGRVIPQAKSPLHAPRQSRD